MPYTVRAGSTVDGISSMYGVTTEVVASALVWPCLQSGANADICNSLYPIYYSSDLANVWASSIGHVIYILGAFPSTWATPKP